MCEVGAIDHGTRQHRLRSAPRAYKAELRTSSRRPELGTAPRRVQLVTNSPLSSPGLHVARSAD
eukprot:3080739-Pleurochrysis_carterae.AAC.5